MLCHRGLLLLHSKCFIINSTVNNYYVEADFQDPSSLFGTNCHNLVDICLGPVDFYSDVAIYESQELDHVAHLIKEVINPNPVLKYVDDSLGSITMTTINEIEEQCQVVAEIPDQPIVELDDNFLELEKPTIGISDLERELDSLMKNTKIYLDKAREYMKKIEEIADFVDSQICDPPKKKIRNAFEAEEPIFDFEEEVEDEDSAEGEQEDSLIYHVEAIRDISSAYRDAGHEIKNAFMNLMVGKPYAKILDERPLMVPKLKSAKSIQGLRPQFINTILYSTVSNNAENMEIGSHWLDAPTISSTSKLKLCRFVLLPLGLLFIM
ncbi:unnamed protein product [Rodentolepis nana]|uniref:RNA-directed DNA polymerase, eukaryota, reverse transcriptase zinc-binding domain protein n=1 Tax=Rodentolepis nana TaxID=102285 RepID=A0A158QHH1_RODNA|nr:unnamed protein product [Rodentolepis nana]